MWRQRRVLLCFLMALASLSARGASVPVHVRVAAQTSDRPVAIELQVIGGTSGKEQTESLIPAEAPGVQSLDLPDPGVWYVQARAVGFWGETRVLVTPYAGKPVELRLWPAVTLRGEITTAVRLPGVSVRFQPVLDRATESAQDPFPAGTSDCRLDGRKFECIVPAGRADYSLRSAGSMPVYRWDQNHDPGEVVNLGKVEFRRGSSLIGRVTAADGAVFAKDLEVRVTLAPSGAGEIPSAEKERSRMARATVLANKRGIFVFEGIRPGGYQLSASAPGLLSETREVTVLDALEAELREPLTLAAPRTLDVTIEPATDPWRGVWTVDLLRMNTRSEQGILVASASADANGRWRRDRLVPADYVVNVRRHPQGVWHSQAISLHEDVHLDVNIPLVRVAGTLTLGGAPLSGSLWFGGERGAISVPVTTSQEGLFRGILPDVESGTWAKVDIVAESPAVRRTIKDLRIPAPGDDGISRLDVDLPSNRVFGEVTTERGEPVSSATVFLSVPGADGELLQMHADEAGQFSFHGLQAATYAVRAISPSGNSDSVDIAVTDHSREFVTLVVKQSDELRGIVSSRYGPVARARVSAYPDDRSGFGLVEWNLTDPEGRFRVAVPPGAHHVTLTVSAPGFAFDVFGTAVDAQRLVPIQLEQDDGRLVITLNGRGLPFLFHGSGFVALQDLLGDRIAALEGQTVTVDHLRPGQYEVCIATAAEALAFARTMRPKERCTAGFVPPGGTLVLDVPSRGETEKR